MLRPFGKVIWQCLLEFLKGTCLLIQAVQILESHPKEVKVSGCKAVYTQGFGGSALDTPLYAVSFQFCILPYLRAFARAVPSAWHNFSHDRNLPVPRYQHRPSVTIMSKTCPFPTFRMFFCISISAFCSPQVTMYTMCYYYISC